MRAIIGCKDAFVRRILAAVGPLLAGMLLWAGCDPTSEVTGVDLPEEPVRLVVNAYLDPDAPLISVYAGASNPVSYQQWRPLARSDYFHRYPILSNAAVHIEEVESGRKQLLDVDSSVMEYCVGATAFRLQRGGTYRVHVWHPDYGEAVATCTVPTGEHVALQAKASAMGVTYRIAIPREPERYFYINATGITKKNSRYKDFKTISSASSIEGFVMGSISMPPEIAQEETSWLLQVWELDKEGYLYLSRLKELDAMEDDPFAVPVPAYSNVKGGLGNVCGVVFQDSVAVQ